MGEGHFCLTVGAGAIGKAVAGYLFTQLGCEVVFADVDEATIQDINRRGGYILHTAQKNRVEKQNISGIRGIHLNEDGAAALAARADYLCTAIGPFGMNAFLPVLADWLRAMHGRERPLYLCLFENDFALPETITAYLEKNTGGIPLFLRIVQTSVERMSRIQADGTSRDVVCEQYIPVIVRQDAAAGSILAASPFIQAVNDLERYYKRKLYTNNLGHAALAYIGLTRGHKTADSAVGDAFVRERLERALNESGEMLCRAYGFSRPEIEAHLVSLLRRYENPHLADSLERLAREPLRKLGKQERIAGALHCCRTHRLPADGIIEVLSYAVRFCLRDTSGLQPEKLLTDICGLDAGSDDYIRTLGSVQKLSSIA